MMDAQDNPVAIPEIEVDVNRRARRKISWNGTPLASRAKTIRQPIDNLAQIDRAFVPSASGRRDQRSDKRPLLTRRIGGIAKLAAVVPPPP